MKQKILQLNGIITEDESKPVPVNAECAICKFVNSLENKFCSKCAYPLSVTAYEEIKAEETREIDALKSQVQALTKNVKESDFYLRFILTDFLKWTTVENPEPDYVEFQARLRKIGKVPNPDSKRV